MIIHSIFQQDQPIPAKYTCDGENISPPLTISGIPSEAKSLTLIMDDPDAPRGTFDHWIVWNLPPDLQELSEGAKEFLSFHSRPIQGVNGYNKNDYKGPCPPPGKVHHYHFKIYALDMMLDLPEGSTKHQVEKAMEGHILARGELIGTYKK